MEFAWDEDKSDRCLNERGFDFAFAVLIFENPTLNLPDDRKDYGERRLIALGEILGQVCKLVYTDRDQTRRVISAHRASRREKRKWQSFIER